MQLRCLLENRIAGRETPIQATPQSDRRTLRPVARPPDHFVDVVLARLVGVPRLFAEMEIPRSSRSGPPLRCMSQYKPSSRSIACCNFVGFMGCSFRAFGADAIHLPGRVQ